jgi:Tol biopolymer transport system component
MAVAAAVAGALAVLAQATTSGQNGRIVFKMALGSPSRLAVVGADGKALQKLPRTKQVSDDDPDWSPDGRTIAFSRCPVQDGPCNVFAMPAGGAAAKRLGPAGDDRAQPAWSPNGKQVAYSRFWGGVHNDQIKYSEIYVMNANGGGARQVTRITTSKPFSAEVQRPAWSPDGKQLTFEVTNSAGSEPAKGLALFVVNADGSDLRQVTPWQLKGGGRSDWSPDGSVILFKSPAQRGPGNLYTIAPDGTGLKQITHYAAPTVVWAGSFSPDGKWITYAKSADVHVARADGTGSRQVSHGVSAWAPDWGPAK